MNIGMVDGEPVRLRRSARTASSQKANSARNEAVLCQQQLLREARRHASALRSSRRTESERLDALSPIEPHIDLLEVKHLTLVDLSADSGDTSAQPRWVEVWVVPNSDTHWNSNSAQCSVINPSTPDLDREETKLILPEPVPKRRRLPID